MRALVVGADLPLGAAVVERWGDDDLVALAADEVDLSRPEPAHAAIADVAPQVVVHAGGWRDGERVAADPSAARAATVLTARQLARACTLVDALLVVVSCAEVGDPAAGRPLAEHHPAAPATAVGELHLAAEQAAAAPGCALAVARLGWLEVAEQVDRWLADAGRGERVQACDRAVREPCFPVPAAGWLRGLAAARMTGVWHAAGAGQATAWEVADEALRAAGHPPPLPRAEDLEVDRPRDPSAPAAWAGLDAWVDDPAVGAMPPWREQLADHLRRGASGGR